MADSGLIRNILVSRLRFMGDVILTTPLLAALRTYFPSDRIVYLTQKPFDELLSGHPCVDETLSFSNSPASQYRMLLGLKNRRFDLAIDLFGNPRSAAWTFLSGAPMRIGGDYRGRKLFYTHRIRHDGKTRTAVDFHLDFLAPLSIPASSKETFLSVTRKERDQAVSRLSEDGLDPEKRMIGLHPGASWPAKQWLPERFAELASRLVRELDAEVLLTAGPGEEELARFVQQSCPEPVRLFYGLSIRELMALISCLDVFVSNDCGPMHIGPAVQTPTVGIFGPGEPEIWFPYDREKGHRFVHREMDCSRCHKDFCVERRCMEAVRAEDVFREIAEILKTDRSGREVLRTPHVR
ncbi:glycosyltransferase family 9 protein [bacterium]|nr:glycosyltransferase family 9 protein [bacterium]